MRWLIRSPWLPLAFALVASGLALTLAFTTGNGARGAAMPARRASPATRPVSYLNEVRPIPAQHCFGCHGPDEAARKGKLRLDLKDHAFARRRGHRAIAPGDLDGSLAWERVTSDNDRARMPPGGKDQALTGKQIATLKAWIEQGARWEDHWS